MTMMKITLKYTVICCESMIVFFFSYEWMIPPGRGGAARGGRGGADRGGAPARGGARGGPPGRGGPARGGARGGPPGRGGSAPARGGARGTIIIFL
jgi:hypothetical protein